MKNLLVGLVLIFLTACSDSGGGISGEGNTNLPSIPSGGSNPNSSPDPSEGSNPNSPPDPSGGSNPNLPPDPGEAGKLTIEGIDSDSDGVRDDIQRYIAIEYSDSEKIRRVMTDMAKADQEFIINADDIEKVLEATTKQDKQMDCLFYIDPNGAHQKIKIFTAEILNTETRTRAYIKADSHLGGMTFSVPDVNEWKAQCSFDPDLLEN